MDSSTVFFDLLDDMLGRHTDAITAWLLESLPDDVLEREQRGDILKSNIRKQLDRVAWSIFGLFDNVGCVLPDDVSGWTLHSKADGADIRVGNADYADMWIDFIHDKGRTLR